MPSSGGAFGAPSPLMPKKTATALPNSGLGQRVRDWTAIVDDALQGPDRAARVAALPDVAAEDGAGSAGPDGAVDDLQRLLDGLHLGTTGDQDRHRAVLGYLAEALGVVRLDQVRAVLEGEARGGGHGVSRLGVGDPLTRTGQCLHHQRHIRAQALAGDLGDYAVGLQLDRDADERHHHHAVGTEMKGILHRVQQAPLRVSQPVFAVDARSAVEPEEGGDATYESFPIALHHPEGSHHGVRTGVDRRLDHRAWILQPFYRPERAGVVHRYDQRLAVGCQHRCVARHHPSAPWLCYVLYAMQFFHSLSRNES